VEGCYVVGESTQREIEYAREQGKSIRWLEEHGEKQRS
jgi:hypothetical protein